MTPNPHIASTKAFHLSTIQFKSLITPLESPLADSISSRSYAPTNRTSPKTCNPDQAMQKAWRAIKHELLDILPIWLFFFIALTIVIETDSLLLSEYGIQASGVFAALIGSAIVAKVSVVLNHFSFVDRYHEKPLIYSTLWKTGIYVLGSIAFRYFEELIKFYFRHYSWAEANQIVLNRMSGPRFWIVLIWLSILFFVFCAAQELVRIIGRDRVIQLFFRSPGS